MAKIPFQRSETSAYLGDFGVPHSYLPHIKPEHVGKTVNVRGEAEITGHNTNEDGSTRVHLRMKDLKASRPEPTDEESKFADFLNQRNRKGMS